MTREQRTDSEGESRQATSTAAVVSPTPSPETPTVFGANPAWHVEQMLAALGVAEMMDRGEKAPENVSSILYWNGAAIAGKTTLAHLLERERFALEDTAGRRIAARVDTADAEAAERWLRGEGPAPTGLPVVRVEDLGEVHDKALRKSEPAFCAVVTEENRDEVERRIYASTYKGVTDVVTKYLWPAPAFHLTRWFLGMGFSPNAVTIVGIGFMFAAMAAFWQGLFGWGLAAAWIMALLDTVDGKMARVSHTASAVGNLLDHGTDLIHPPFWYLAWVMGLEKAGRALPQGWVEPLIWTLFLTYVAARLFEGYFIRRFGFHLHVWRRFDSAFRLVVARRNPNLILLTASWAAGRPEVGILLVAAWQLAAVAVHAVQSGQAEWRVRSGPLRSWLQPGEPAPASRH